MHDHAATVINAMAGNRTARGPSYVGLHIRTSGGRTSSGDGAGCCGEGTAAAANPSGRSDSGEDVP
jgi:hypothetical protein